MASWKDFTDGGDWQARLRQYGLSDRAAALHAGVFARLAGRMGDAPSAALFVPGRIEVLGKHTDYAGGDSLVCAVERGFCMLVAAVDTAAATIEDAARGEQIDLRASQPGSPAWGRYPSTVWNRLNTHVGPFASGVRILFESTLPADAGLSSSSALMVGTFLALSAVYGFERDARYRAVIATDLDRADFLGHIENGQTFRTLAGEQGVGTFGGSQDHAAICCSVAGAVSRFRYAPMARAGMASLPEDLTFVVALSGVEAQKTGAARAAYNEASARANRIAERWCAAHGQPWQRLRTIVESPGFSPAAMERLLEGDAPLARRFRHFWAEHGELVPAAFEAFVRHDWSVLGDVVDRSQALAESLLGNQVPETVALAQLARSHGALAASAFGAGFGGAVWALVPAHEATRFRTRWLDSYRAVFPERSQAGVFESRPGPPAGYMVEVP
ncbi:MAG: galactokinase family protein [Rhodothermales bacterium]